MLMLTIAGSRKVISALSFVAVFSLFSWPGSVNAQEQFKEYEIRVIKNKSFQKNGKLEALAFIGALMNKSFIYTYLTNVQLHYHFTETISLFGDAAFGFTFNKSDCSTLGTEYQIEPIVTQVNSIFGGGLSYTPVYGKYQTPSGELIYYDWFLAASGGVSNVKQRQSTCITNKDAVLNVEEKSGNPPQVSFSTGQKYFLDNRLAFNWNIRWMVLRPPVENSKLESSVVLSLGVGYFL